MSTPVFAYHALSTWNNAPGAVNNPRGVQVAKTPEQDTAALINSCKAKGVDGVLLWNRYGFDDNGEMNLGGVDRARNHPDHRVRLWADESQTINQHAALMAAGLAVIEYLPCVPLAWQSLAADELVRRTRAILPWAVLSALVCLDNSGGKSASSADWLVRSTISRDGPTVGCEPTAHVGTPWASERLAFSVISHALWNVRADSWYPKSLPHPEYVLCVGSGDNLQTAQMHYARGAVPCITLDKPWGANDVRGGSK